MLDADQDSFGIIDRSGDQSSVTFKSTEPMKFDIIRIEEAIELGQRVRGFEIAIRQDESWHTIASGTTIGPRRVLRLSSPVEASEIRFDFESPAPVCISELGVYKLNMSQEQPR